LSRLISFHSSKYISIPYKDNGRDEKGVDCWGLARLFYQQELNIELPSYTGEYSSAEERKEVSSTINRHRGSWKVVDCGKEQFGDIVILKLVGLPLHIGVVLGDKKMIHTLKGSGTIIESYDSRIWQNRIFGFVRHKEIENG
jgi:cell wall-associated NlpC family hydrolase